MSDFWSDPSSTFILYVYEQRRFWRGSPEPLLLAYVIRTIISWAGSILKSLVTLLGFEPTSFCTRAGNANNDSMCVFIVHYLGLNEGVISICLHFIIIFDYGEIKKWQYAFLIYSQTFRKALPKMIRMKRHITVRHCASFLKQKKRNPQK